MVDFNACARTALGVGDIGKAFHAHRAEFQVVLVELSDQFTGIDPQPGFEFGVGETRRLQTAHEAAHLLEAGTGRVEANGHKDSISPRRARLSPRPSLR